MDSSSSSVRRFDIDVFEHSPRKLRFVTYSYYIHRKIRTDLDGCRVGTSLERPILQWVLETWRRGPRLCGSHIS